MTDLPRYLDGPKFIDFLSSEGVERRHLTETQKRRYFEWEHGARADIYSTSCDQLLTDNYLHNLIPDDCWATDQQPTRRGPNNRTQNGQWATA